LQKATLVPKDKAPKKIMSETTIQLAAKLRHAVSHVRKPMDLWTTIAEADHLANAVNHFCGV